LLSLKFFKMVLQQNKVIAPWLALLTIFHTSTVILPASIIALAWEVINHVSGRSRRLLAAKPIPRKILVKTLP
jgi:antibiotic biosynthesis monooxygenase (ABM) superfamily enzyme